MKTKQWLSLALTLCMALLLVFTVPLTAEAATTYTYGDWEYTVDSGVATITKYNGSATTVTVPTSINNYLVTVIGNSAFKDNTTMRTVDFPDTLLTIDDYAFSGCVSLTSITLPKKLTTLGEQVFKNCSKVASITINSEALNDVRYFCEPFYGVGSATSGVSVTFTDGCTRIPSHLFRAYSGVNYAANITSVTIASTVTEVGDYAFGDCTKLSTIQFDGYAPTFAENAFYNVTATAHYPRGNGWTGFVLKDYGGDITWEHYGDGSKLENMLNACYEVAELVKGANGTYYTPEGARVYIAVKNRNDTGIIAWLNGYTLYDYVYTFGEEYFDLTYWDALLALMNEDGYVVLTDTSLQYLITTITGNPAWNETEANVPYYLFYDKNGSADVTRLYGDTRFQTAFKIADLLKANLGVSAFDTVIIASGTNFADALSGTYLAAIKNAPILLSCNNDFNPRLVEEFNNMLVEYISTNLTEGGTVYILGGEKAVDPSLDNALSGYRVVRLAGATRYETNIAILKEAGASNQEILICYGENFPDSLAASATRKPIMLVKTKLNDVQKDFLRTTTGDFVIIGGTAVVSESMENELSAYGTIERLAGANRYKTCLLVAERFFDDPDTAVLAYGENFPDGLCGGVLAYSMDAPLILIRNDHLTAANDYTAYYGITGGIVLGGTGLISDDSVRAIFAMDVSDQIIVK